MKARSLPACSTAEQFDRSKSILLILEFLKCRIFVYVPLFCFLRQPANYDCRTVGIPCTGLVKIGNALFNHNFKGKLLYQKHRITIFILRNIRILLQVFILLNAFQKPFTYRKEIKQWRQQIDFFLILYEACITMMSLLAFNDLSCHVIKTN